MADPGTQLTFEQLPPRVQEDFQAIKRTLGPDLKIGNFRAVAGGWAASIYTLEGEEGGDYFVMSEPGAGQDG